MPMSRGRKAKTKKQKLSQQQNQKLTEKTLWEKTRGTLSSIGAIIGILGFTVAAFRGPEIHAHPGIIENPFELRFSLHNPSWILSIKEMRFTCSAKDVRLTGNTAVVGLNLVESGLTAAMRPGETKEYACPFNRFLSGPDKAIISARITIAVSFKTLWYNRAKESEQFSWNVRSKQWIEGDVIN